MRIDQLQGYYKEVLYAADYAIGRQGSGLYGDNTGDMDNQGGGTGSYIYLVRMHLPPMRVKSFVIRQTTASTGTTKKMRANIYHVRANSRVEPGLVVNAAGDTEITLSANSTGDCIEAYCPASIDIPDWGYYVLGLMPHPTITGGGQMRSYYAEVPHLWAEGAQGDPLRSASQYTYSAGMPTDLTEDSLFGLSPGTLASADVGMRWERLT
jgi:hypothetical protein